MKTKVFITLVKSNENFGCSDYVVGRLSGIMLGLRVSVDKNTHPQVYTLEHMVDGTLIGHVCSEEVYEMFAEIVEERYQDLCVFDYKS